jgi:hypothetical protein
MRFSDPGLGEALTWQCRCFSDRRILLPQILDDFDAVFSTSYITHHDALWML